MEDLAREVYRAGFVFATVATVALAVALVVAVVRPRGAAASSVDRLVRASDAGWAGLVCLAAIAVGAIAAGERTVALDELIVAPVVFGLATAAILALGRRVAPTPEGEPWWASAAALALPLVFGLAAGLSA